MCKLIYSMTVSLDGYISGPQGEGCRRRLKTDPVSTGEF